MRTAQESCHSAYSYELIVRAPLLGTRRAACDDRKAMKDQQDYRPQRSTATWLARVAAIARAKTGLDLTFVIAVAA
jgi:hypothetical protein